MTTLRTATVSDFKVGATLVTSEGYEFTITKHYSEGVWEARGQSGTKCVYKDEVRLYKIQSNA